MTPDEFLSEVLRPGLVWLEALVGPVPPPSSQARIQLLVTAGQETHWRNVQQSGGGPGRGYFQFEPETCGLLLRNPASTGMVHMMCNAHGLAPTEEAIYGALLGQPLLQVGLARADYWCDPRPLAAYGDAAGAWITYKRDWGPGKPHPALWDGLYAESMKADKRAFV